MPRSRGPRSGPPSSPRTPGSAGASDTEEHFEEEEAGEEDLWFEKGPPKDFDFDD